MKSIIRLYATVGFLKNRKDDTGKHAQRVTLCIDEHIHKEIKARRKNVAMA